MMCEVPSNAVLAESFLEHFDGMSIGSNDLTQLTLGLDRDSGLELLARDFDERDPAVKALISRAIAACRATGKYIGICGQGPSDHPDFADWLADEGIVSISLNPDTRRRDLEAAGDAHAPSSERAGPAPVRAAAPCAACRDTRLPILMARRSGAVGGEAVALVEAHRAGVLGGDREGQHLEPGLPGLGDARLEEERAEAGAARLGPHHHADDVADVAHLEPLLALAADRAEQPLAAPGAEHELAAVAPLEAEPMQVVGRAPCARRSRRPT